METTAPTREWQRIFAYEPPKVDQKTNKAAYTRLSPFERLAKSNEIEPEMLRASDKYAKHYWGALGHDVRTGDGITEDPLEFPAQYHAQMILRAKSALILPNLYGAVESQVTENMSLVTLGQHLRPVKDRAIARNIAVTTISTALDILAYHWGFKTRPG